MSFSIRKFIGHLIPPIKSTVGIWDSTGKNEEIELEIKKEEYIPFSKEKTEEITNNLLNKVVSFLNSPSKLFQEEKNIKLMFLDSGGANGSSIFSFDLSNYAGKKQLFLMLSRDEDRSADTVCFYSISCPKKIDDSFKEYIKSCINNLITKSSYALWMRSATRTTFMKNIVKN